MRALRSVWLATAALLLVQLAVLPVEGTASGEAGLSDGHFYGLYVDCGSSKTKARIFTWESPSFTDAVENNQLAEAASGSDGLRNSLSVLDYGENPGQAGDVLEGILEAAYELIPASRHISTRLAVGLPYKLKDVDREHGEGTFDEIVRALRETAGTFPFQLSFANVRVMNAQEEGVFGWVATNYLRTVFNPNIDESDRESPVGVMDLGSSGFSLAFAPHEAQRRYIPHAKSYNMTFLDERYHLYADFYAGFGFDATHTDHLNTFVLPAAERTAEGVLQAPNDCYFLGYSETHTGVANASEAITIVGTSRPDECSKQLQGILARRANDAPAPAAKQLFTDVRFAGYASLGYLGEFMGIQREYVTQQWLASNGKLLCLDSYQIAVDKHGASPFLPKQCLSALYSAALLEWLGMDPTKATFRLTRKMRDQDISWAMGAYIFMEENHPSLGDLPDYVADVRNQAVIIAVILVLVLFLSALLFLFHLRMKRLHKMVVPGAQAVGDAEREQLVTGSGASGDVSTWVDKPGESLGSQLSDVLAVVMNTYAVCTLGGVLVGGYVLCKMLLNGYLVHKGYMNHEEAFVHSGAFYLMHIELLLDVVLLFAWPLVVLYGVLTYTTEVSSEEVRKRCLQLGGKMAAMAFVGLALYALWYGVDPTDSKARDGVFFALLLLAFVLWVHHLATRVGPRYLSSIVSARMLMWWQLVGIAALIFAVYVVLPVFWEANDGGRLGIRLFWFPLLWVFVQGVDQWSHAAFNDAAMHDGVIVVLFNTITLSVVGRVMIYLIEDWAVLATTVALLGAGEVAFSVAHLPIRKALHARGHVESETAAWLALFRPRRALLRQVYVAVDVFALLIAPAMVYGLNYLHEQDVDLQQLALVFTMQLLVQAVVDAVTLVVDRRQGVHVEEPVGSEHMSAWVAFLAMSQVAVAGALLHFLYDAYEHYLLRTGQVVGHNG